MCYRLKTNNVVYFSLIIITSPPSHPIHPPFCFFLLYGISNKFFEQKMVVLFSYLSANSDAHINEVKKQIASGRILDANLNLFPAYILSSSIPIHTNTRCHIDYIKIFSLWHYTYSYHKILYIAVQHKPFYFFFALWINTSHIVTNQVRHVAHLQVNKSLLMERKG